MVEKKRRDVRSEAGSRRHCLAVEVELCEQRCGREGEQDETGTGTKGTLQNPETELAENKLGPGVVLDVQ